MKKLPLLHYINEIKQKLGFSRTLTASGADVVDAVNTVTSSVGNLSNLNTTAKSNMVAAVNEVSGQIGDLHGGLGYVSNGNNHPAIPIAHFVYVTNHSTLAEGLYYNKTSSTISANEPLTSNNLSIASNGGFNNKIDIPFTLAANITNAFNQTNCVAYGRIATLTLSIRFDEQDVNSWITVLSFGGNFGPAVAKFFPIVESVGNTFIGIGSLSYNGVDIKINRAINTDDILRTSVSWVIGG